MRRVRDGEVTLIDVRPREEYVAAHIPGAISVPLAELGKRLRTLQKRRDIVAYCRGPYFVMALDAVDLLRREGFRAHRMEQGVPEWRAQGWRVETGEDRHAGALNPIAETPLDRPFDRFAWTPADAEQETARA